MAILPIAEIQGELAQTGGWQKDMARRRFQRGSLRKRGKKNPAWELQWWADVINPDGTFGRKRESMILGYASEFTRKQAWKLAQDHLRPLNRGGSFSALRCDVSRVCRTSLCSHFSAHAETRNSKEVSVNHQHSFAPRLRLDSIVRDLAGSRAICSATSCRRFSMWPRHGTSTRAKILPPL